MFKCPICEGEGELVEFDLPELGRYANDCGACKASGSVSILWILERWFWNTVPVRFVEWYGDFVMRKEKKA